MDAYHLRVLRLAHKRPELRSVLVPLLKQGSGDFSKALAELNDFVVRLRDAFIRDPVTSWEPLPKVLQRLQESLRAGQWPSKGEREDALKMIARTNQLVSDEIRGDYGYIRGETQGAADARRQKRQRLNDAGRTLFGLEQAIKAYPLTAEDAAAKVRAEKERAQKEKAERSRQRAERGQSRLLVEDTYPPALSRLIVKNRLQSVDLEALKSFVQSPQFTSVRDPHLEYRFSQWLIRNRAGRTKLVDVSDEDRLKILVGLAKVLR